MIKKYFESNEHIRLRQIGSGIFIIFLIVLVVVYFKSSNNPLEDAISESQTSFTNFDGAEAEDVWLQNAEGRVELLEKQSQEIFRINQELSSRNQALVEEKESLVGEIKSLIDYYDQVLREIDSKAIADFPAVNSGSVSLAPVSPDDPFTNTQLPPEQNAPQASGDPFAGGGGGDTLPATPVASLVRFNLVAAVPEIEIAISQERDPKLWLPAGSYASAVMIAGADAPVSAASQADPRPVVMRVTGEAISAANRIGNTTKTDITGCTITGEARGDLSSERVYIRLLTMTCRRGSGIIETNVRGFVAGSGQAGVRGPVISREGDLVQKSFAAGVVGGFGDAAGTAFAPQALFENSGNTQSDRESLEDSLQSGFAGGLGTAGDTLSQYYIERAEQYQPVVSLNAGTPVEVIFLQGSWLDGRGIIPTTIGGTQ